MKFKVLVVDNDPEMLDLLRQRLENDGRIVTAVADGAAAIEALGRDGFDVVLTDLVMDGTDGWAVLPETQRRQPSARVVLMTAFASLETRDRCDSSGAYAIDEAVQAGSGHADDQPGPRRSSPSRGESGAPRASRATLQLRQPDRPFPGDAVVFDRIRAVTTSDATILLLGESGTGKELVARAIDDNSLRRRQAIRRRSTAAIPRDLLEAELFGHEKGAFHGAIRKRRGSSSTPTADAFSTKSGTSRPCSRVSTPSRAARSHRSTGWRQRKRFGWTCGS